MIQLLRLALVLAFLSIATSSKQQNTKLQRRRRKLLQSSTFQWEDQNTEPGESGLPEFNAPPDKNDDDNKGVSSPDTKYDNQTPDEEGVFDEMPTPEQLHYPNPDANSNDQQQEAPDDDEGITNVIPNPGQLHNPNPDQVPDDQGVINVIPNPGQLHNPNPDGDKDSSSSSNTNNQPPYNQGITNVIPNPGQLHNPNPDGGDDNTKTDPADDEGIINVIPNPGQLQPVPTQQTTMPPTDARPTPPPWIDTRRPTPPPWIDTIPPTEYQTSPPTPLPTLVPTATSEVYQPIVPNTAGPTFPQQQQQQQQQQQLRYTLLPFALVVTSPALATTATADLLPTARQLEDLTSRYLLEYFQAVAPLQFTSSDPNDPMVDLLLHVKEIPLKVTLQWMNNNGARDVVWAECYGTIHIQKDRRLQRTTTTTTRGLLSNIQLSQEDSQNLFDQVLTQALDPTSSLPLLQQRLQSSADDNPILRDMTSLNVHFQFQSSENNNNPGGMVLGSATASSEDTQNEDDWSFLEIAMLGCIVAFVLAAALFLYRRRFMRPKYYYDRELEDFMIYPDNPELYFDEPQQQQQNGGDALFTRNQQIKPQVNLQHYRNDSETQQLYFDQIYEKEQLNNSFAEDYQLPDEEEGYMPRHDQRRFTHHIQRLVHKLRPVPRHLYDSAATAAAAPPPSHFYPPSPKRQKDKKLFAYRDFPRHDGTPCLLYNENADPIAHKEDKEEEEIRFGSDSHSSYYNLKGGNRHHLFADDNSTIKSVSTSNTNAEQYEDYKDPTQQMTLEMSKVFRTESANELLVQEQKPSNRSITSTNSLEVFLPKLERLYELKHRRYQQWSQNEKQERRQRQEALRREQQLEQGSRLRQQQTMESPKPGVSPWEREVQMRTAATTKAPMAPSFDSSDEDESNDESTEFSDPNRRRRSSRRRRVSDGRGVVESILDNTRLSLSAASPRPRGSIVAPAETLDRFFVQQKQKRFSKMPLDDCDTDEIFNGGATDDSSPALSIRKSPTLLTSKSKSRPSVVSTRTASIASDAAVANPPIRMKTTSHNPFSSAHIDPNPNAPPPSTVTTTTPSNKKLYYKNGHVRHHTPVSPMSSNQWSPDYFASPLHPGSTTMMMPSPRRSSPRKHNNITCMSPRSIDADPTMVEQEEEDADDKNIKPVKFSPRKQPYQWPSSAPSDEKRPQFWGSPTHSRNNSSGSFHRTNTTMETMEDDTTGSFIIPHDNLVDDGSFIRRSRSSSNEDDNDKQQQQQQDGSFIRRYHSSSWNEEEEEEEQKNRGIRGGGGGSCPDLVDLNNQHEQQDATTNSAKKKKQHRRHMSMDHSTKKLADEEESDHQYPTAPSTKQPPSFKKRHRRYHSHGTPMYFGGTFRTRDNSSSLSFDASQSSHLETIEPSPEQKNRHRRTTSNPPTSEAFGTAMSSTSSNSSTGYHHRRHRSHSALYDDGDDDDDSLFEGNRPPLFMPRPYGQRHHPLDNPAPPPRITQSSQCDGSFHDADSLDDIDLQQQQDTLTKEQQQHRRHNSDDPSHQQQSSSQEHRRYHSLNSPMRFLKNTFLKFVEEESQEGSSMNDSMTSGANSTPRNSNTTAAHNQQQQYNNTMMNNGRVPVVVLQQQQQEEGETQ